MRLDGVQTVKAQRAVSGSTDPIPTLLWCEIIRALGETGFWTGNIRRVQVKLERLDKPQPGVRYHVQVGNAWVSGIRPTGTEAVEYCGSLIQEAIERRSHFQ